ncbi:hypothetical protein NBCG_04880 [Nocardioidaceae bacterium Broad-1]|nr:hypothetical protein NBCG_04880 [Nocardioidaceae bacterium Broad-1]
MLVRHRDLPSVRARARTIRRSPIAPDFRLCFESGPERGMSATGARPCGDETGNLQGTALARASAARLPLCHA